MVIQWDEPEAENGPIEVCTFLYLKFLQQLSRISLSVLMPPSFN